MSKLVGSIGVPDGIQTRDLVMSGVYTTSQKIEQPSSYPYNNQPESAKIKTDPVTQGDKVHPTGYHIFVGKSTGSQFDYKYGSSNTSRLAYRISGITPVETPLGPGYHHTYNCSFAGGMPIPPIMTCLNLENQAYTEALNKLQDGKMSVLTSLAEAKDTINTVAKISKSLVQSYRHFRRGNYAEAAKWISGSGGRPSRRGNSSVSKLARTKAHDAVLTYNYAVMPLLSDIQGAFALAAQGLKDNPCVTGHRFVSQELDLPPMIGLNRTRTAKGKSTAGAEVQLKAKLNDTTVGLLEQMGLYNPFSLAWDLLPYSFVIDWLIPVGNTLQALTAPLNLTFHSGYANHKLVNDFTIKGAPSTHNQASGSFPSLHVETVCQLRKPISALSLPRLYIKSPFSTSHVVSAIALISAAKR